MKNIYKVILLAGLTSSIVGCSNSETTPTTNGKEEVTSQLPAQTVAKISDADVEKLVGTGYAHFSVLLNGGGPKLGETFTQDNKSFRYLGTDMDTKAEAIKYLEETYTSEVADEILKKYKFIERDGKLTQPVTELYSALSWQDGKVSLVGDNDTERIYEIKLPIEGAEGKFETRQVVLKYIDNKGWRISKELI